MYLEKKVARGCETFYFSEKYPGILERKIQEAEGEEHRNEEKEKAGTRILAYSGICVVVKRFCGNTKKEIARHFISSG